MEQDKLLGWLQPSSALVFTVSSLHRPDLYLYCVGVGLFFTLGESLLLSRARDHTEQLLQVCKTYPLAVRRVEEEV